MSAHSSEIDVAALQNLRAKGEAVTIIDVREPWERDICAIAGSVAIPMAELPERIDELPEDGTVVMLCHHGMRSLQAASWLRDHGYEHVVSLSGGIDSWAAEVEPGMRRY